LNPKSKNMNTNSNVLVTKAKQVLYVTINRPHVLNALNTELLDELHRVLDSFLPDNSLRGAIIRGAGEKAFVAGADLAEFTGLQAEEAFRISRRGQSLFDKIAQSRKPIIAAINGLALGGGCELAMACHLRIAAESAKFGQPEVGLGLIPGYGGTQRMVSLVGKGKAMELILTGLAISAQEANRIGLVNEVVPADALIPRCEEILAVILSRSANAVGKAITAIQHEEAGSNEGYEAEAWLFAECFDHTDAIEGVNAFVEKRKPNFQ
jgi:enoyl-CoA hydratase